MTREIKAKVLEYKVFYHGIFDGRAKLKLLEGENKKKIITIPVVGYCKKGDVITIYESENENPI